MPGSFEVTPHQLHDERGTFLEWYRWDALEQAVGHPLRLAQANCSVSSSGVMRGIHYADVPPGQAKYVTCARGTVLDAVVDIRVGSPTFGSWDLVRLDEDTRRAVYVCEGLGHAFIALTRGATVVYLCSEVHHPERERRISALDAEIGIAWPRNPRPVLSRTDASAPGLSEAAERGLLPRWTDCVAYAERLRTTTAVVADGRQ